MPSGCTNNFPWNWAWPRSRDPTIFGIRSNISLKLLELETSNLILGFVWTMPQDSQGAQINFPEGGRGLGHVTLHFLAVRSAILATAWLLVYISSLDFTVSNNHVHSGYWVGLFTVPSSVLMVMIDLLCLSNMQCSFFLFLLQIIIWLFIVFMLRCFVCLVKFIYPLFLWSVIAVLVIDSYWLPSVCLSSLIWCHTT